MGNATMTQKRNASRFLDMFLSRSASKCLGRNAPKFLNRNVPKFPDRNVKMFLDRNVRMFPNSSAQLSTCVRSVHNRPMDDKRGCSFFKKESKSTRFSKTLELVNSFF